MSLHLMLDLETLDTKPSAVVLQIGAVLFDPNDASKPILDVLDLVLHPEAQDAALRTRSAATINWWATQPPEAQAVFHREKHEVDYALRLVRELFDECNGEIEGVWGNGAAFDNVILRSLFDDFGVETPWMFWQDRCFRTLKELPGAKALKPDFEGIAHNAVHDARHQVRHMQAIVKHFGLKV